MRYLLCVIILFQLTSCSSESTDKVSSTQSNGTTKTTYHNDYTIHRYLPVMATHSSNSYWIEGPDGVVIIDAQMTEEDTRELVQIAESASGKKVLLAIILHASTSRTQGIAAFKSQGIPVVSSRPVVEELRHQVVSKKAGAAMLPEARWQQTAFFDAAGLRFRAYVIHGAINESHLLIELDKQLFVGDLLLQGHHLLPADTRRWLERLEQINKFTEAQRIYPGRGHVMSGPALIQLQTEYIQRLQRAVADIYTGGRITERDIQDISRRLVEHYPRYAGKDSLSRAISREWERQRNLDHQMM